MQIIMLSAVWSKQGHISEFDLRPCQRSFVFSPQIRMTKHISNYLSSRGIW
jgi:hypothetical protein